MESLPAASISSESTPERTGELLRTALELMRRLEASLGCSRKALLALDLAGIERGTREQTGLMRQLEVVVQERMIPPSVQKPSGERAPFRELDEEVRQRGNGVLAAARLQTALLARAQGKLRVLANMLAGSSVDYGPLVARNGAPGKVFDWKRGGEADPCRV